MYTVCVQDAMEKKEIHNSNVPAVPKQVVIC